MARALSDSHELPLGVINGARGGQPVAHFQRNDANPVDPATSCGWLLIRARAVGVDQAARALLCYQGESDGAKAAGHHDGWVVVHAAWMQDDPGLDRSCVTQIRLGAAALPSTRSRCRGSPKTRLHRWPDVRKRARSAAQRWCSYFPHPAQGDVTLSHAGHTGAGPWVVNGAGVGLLAFDKVLVEPTP